MFEPRNISSVDLEIRRNRIITNYELNVLNNLELNVTNNLELNVINNEKVGLLGKVKLGFKYVSNKLYDEVNKLESMYIKYNEVSRRHFYWTVWEKKRNVYSSYQEFKCEWDGNTSIWQEIKNKLKVNIKNDVESLIQVNDPFNRRLRNNNVERIIYESSRRRR